MKRLKVRPVKAGLVVFSLIIAGCATTPQEERQAELEKPLRVSAEANVISEEDFKKIPKGLRPEELEQRDDTTIVIRSGSDKTIKEYRVGPFLYAIYVTPKIGPPYYLVAADNQGNFIRADKPEMLIPSWTIFEWK